MSFKKRIISVSDESLKGAELLAESKINLLKQAIKEAEKHIEINCFKEFSEGLNELVDKIINELDYESLNASQKIKLLDVALKYSLPRLSIEKSIEQIEEPRKFEITIVGENGETETHSTPLDENFTLKKAFGFE